MSDMMNPPYHWIIMSLNLIFVVVFVHLRKKVKNLLLRKLFFSFHLRQQILKSARDGFLSWSINPVHSSSSSGATNLCSHVRRSDSAHSRPKKSNRRRGVVKSISTVTEINNAWLTSDSSSIRRVKRYFYPFESCDDRTTTRREYKWIFNAIVLGLN